VEYILQFVNRELHLGQDTSLFLYTYQCTNCIKVSLLKFRETLGVGLIPGKGELTDLNQCIGNATEGGEDHRCTIVDIGLKDCRNGLYTGWSAYRRTSKLQDFHVLFLLSVVIHKHDGSVLLNFCLSWLMRICSWSSHIVPLGR